MQKRRSSRGVERGSWSGRNAQMVERCCDLRASLHLRVTALPGSPRARLHQKLQSVAGAKKPQETGTKSHPKLKLKLKLKLKVQGEYLSL